MFDPSPVVRAYSIEGCLEVSTVTSLKYATGY